MLAQRGTSAAACTVAAGGQAWTTGAGDIASSAAGVTLGGTTDGAGEGMEGVEDGAAEGRAMRAAAGAGEGSEGVEDGAADSWLPDDSK